MPLLRNKHHTHDPLWHTQLILLGIIAMQISLSSGYSPLLRYGIPTLELLLMIALQFVTPKLPVYESRRRRLIAVILIALIAVANLTALQQLLEAVLKTHNLEPAQLFFNGLVVYATTLVTFAMFYWEMDGGGPGERRKDKLENHDFLFPQQHYFRGNLEWHPTFIDYFYLSLTNMTNFTSSDTLPLSRRAKMLMGFQSIISLAVVILVTARAISVL